MYSVCAFILTPKQAPPTNEQIIVEARNSIKSLVPIDQTRSMNEIKQANGTAAMRVASSESSLSASSALADPSEEVRKEKAHFDQINVESELTSTHTERREPNGTVYFVERRTSEDFALQMLDKAIEPSERESEESVDDSQTPEAISYDEVEPPIETVALVHREEEEAVEDKHQTTAAPPEIAEDNDSGILVVSQMSLNDPKSIDGSTTDQIENSDSLLPITHHIVGTKTLPLNRGHKHERGKSLTMGPVKPSKSETDLRSLLFEEIKRFKKADDDEEVIKNPLPVSNSSETPLGTPSPSIPEPPKFDPIKYDLLGTMPRNNKIKVGTMKRKAPSPPVQDEEPPPEETTVSLRSPNFAKFKNKLEALYSHGPPSNLVKDKQFIRSKSHQPLGSPNAQSPVPDEPIMVAKANLKPTDTVHRQKLLFNDVLKAINPDTRPSDNIKHETHTT